MLHLNIYQYWKMAQFQLNGHVVGTGGSTGSTNMGKIDLYYDIGFGSGGSVAGFNQKGVVRSAGDGSFHVVCDVPDAATAENFPRLYLLRLQIIAYLPAAGQNWIDLSSLMIGTGQQVFNQMESMAQHITLQVDLTGIHEIPISITLKGPVPQLDSVDELGLHLMNGGNTVASAPAKRTGNQYHGVLRCRSSELIDASSLWIRAQERRAHPMDVRAVILRDPGRIFVRTIALGDFNQLTMFAKDNILLADFEENSGLGSISGGLPEQIVNGLLIARQLDLDFINGEIRLRGNFGWGFNGFQIAPLGSFVVRYSVRVPERAWQPFKNEELVEPVSITTESVVFDLLPGTDVDDGIGLITAVEQFVADLIAPQIRDRVVADVAVRVQSAIDDSFTDLMNMLPPSIATEQYTENIRATFFLCVDTVSVDANNIVVRGFSGIWHDVANAVSGDCPASTASAMFHTQKPLEVFRRFEQVLSHKDLKPWMAEYRKYAKELASVAAGHPLLAARFVRMAFDLAPYTSNDADLVFSAEAVEEVNRLLKSVRTYLSDEAARFIDQASAVIARCEGNTPGEMIRIAAAAVLRDT